LNTKTDYLETSLQRGKERKCLIIIQKVCKLFPTENRHTFHMEHFTSTFRKDHR
jgi:hypothetical protein